MVNMKGPSLARLGRRAFCGVIAWAAIAGAAGIFAAEARAQSDADFLAAKESFEHGDKAKLDALAPSLKGHILAPYVMYWQLKARIDDADYDAVRGFLTEYASTPLADRLRVEWLQ